MTERILRSTSNTSATVSDVVLYGTSTTRLVLRAEIARNPNDPAACVGIALVHQRKGAAQEWEDCPTFSRAQIPSGQEVKLSLDTATTKALYEQIGTLAQIYTEFGIPDGIQRVLVLNESEVLQSDSETIAALKAALKSSGPEELVKFISESFPDLIKKMSLAQIQESRSEALIEFENMLADDSTSESDWQRFFEGNTWIFGYGLRYQFLNTEASQAMAGAPSFTGRGAQRGDFLLSTVGDIKFTVLVEIKKPSSPLFHGMYRNGVAQLSGELVGGISQIQVNTHSWATETASLSANRDLLHDAGVYTCEPKALLIIGKLSQCDGDRAKRTTFEAFRRSLSNPEIVTFDELLMRARHIVELPVCPEIPRSEQQAAAVDDDCPF